MTRSATTALALLLGACAFTEVPPPPSSIAVNECENTDECNGGRCISGICEASRTIIDTLLVEVNAPSSDAQLGGMTFYTQVEGYPNTIAVGPAGSVTPTITVDFADADPSPCRYEGPPPVRAPLPPSNSTIPARITLVPSELETLGVATPSYFGATGPGSGADWVLGEDDYVSTIDLPPGDYDIYIEPRLIKMDPPLPLGCEIPPLLIRRQNISYFFESSFSGTVSLAVTLPPRTPLALTIRGPVGDQSLVGWTIDVLDSITGKLLSVPRTLATPIQSEAGSDYDGTVAFVPAHTITDGTLVPDEALEGREIIRLSPPEDVIAPTFLFERLGVDLSSGPDIVDLMPPGANSNFGSPLPPIVHVEGQVVEFSTGLPVEAAVTLSAGSIEGASNAASFVTTIQANEEGVFSADVPPGTYWARAEPPLSLGFASALTTWQVRATPQIQAGKVIEVRTAPKFQGEAFLSGVGGPAFGATASAVLSPLGVRTTVLQRAMLGGKASELAPPLPRTQAGIVARDGSFEVSADPGRYDFFVKPEARSNYSWLVRPMIEMPADGFDLRRLRLPLPYVYRGVIVIDGTTTRVPGALVRAYAYQLVPLETNEVSYVVVPVAETRTDENGVFDLLIPASLDGG